MKGIGGPLCTIAATSFDSVLIFSKNLKKILRTCLVVVLF